MSCVLFVDWVIHILLLWKIPTILGKGCAIAQVVRQRSKINPREVCVEFVLDKVTGPGFSSKYLDYSVSVIFPLLLRAYVLLVIQSATGRSSQHVISTSVLSWGFTSDPPLTRSEVKNSVVTKWCHCCSTSILHWDCWSCTKFKDWDQREPGVPIRMSCEVLKASSKNSLVSRQRGAEIGWVKDCIPVSFHHPYTLQSN
jgi:hypothetical protein